MQVAEPAVFSPDWRPATPITHLFGLDVDLMACGERPPRAPGRSAPDRSTRCRSPTTHLRRSLAPTSCAIAMSMSARALLQFHRCLAENGWLVVNLPAYRWMLSRHDAAVHNVRRYTARRRVPIVKSGRVPRRLRYLLEHGAISVDGDDTEASSQVAAVRPAMLRRTLARSTCCAARRQPSKPSFCEAGLRLPFGGSVLAIATKGGLPVIESGRKNLETVPPRFALSIVIPVYNGAG